MEKLKQVTVLYCEDEPELREVTSSLLDRVVLRVLSAKDGAEGLRLFQEYRDEIDMVITDINMPNLNGLEMTKAIKEMVPYMPVIVTTAYSSTDHLFEAIDIHVDKYVLKPLDAKKLLEAMEQSMLYHELRSLCRDPLTNLKTRNALIRDLEKSGDNRLVLVGIEEFSHIQDLYGEEISTKTLVALTQKFHKFFDDRYEIYRVGFDRFVLWDRHPERAVETVYPALEAFEKECNKQGVSVAGIPIHLILVFALAHSNDGHTLYYTQYALRKAMKSHLKFIVYNPEDDKDSIQHKKNIYWTLELQRAEESGKFVPFYQPIVDTKTQEIDKYEALIRYVDETGKHELPAAFLDIAKKSHLYSIITRVVLRHVIETVRTKKVRVSVNISYIDLVNQDSLNDIETLLEENPDEAKLIDFEILESEKIDNYDLMGNFIEAVRRYGCRVGIDDFGAGYSNFSILEGLHVDFVKIDGLLIQGIHRSHRQELIVEAIYEFCKKLGIKTVAEMVSCEEEYAVIKRIGIDRVQGWYLSEEISRDDIPDA